MSVYPGHKTADPEPRPSNRFLPVAPAADIKEITMTETSKGDCARPTFLRKGEQTRAAILDVALDLASRDGLEG
jgi:hypothetical protein